MVLSDCRILLVDDEKQILEINKKLLSENGFNNVLYALNGEEADKIMEKEQADLVVLDIMMPGVSGLSLYESWKKRGINIPVIFLSARDEETSRLKGLGLGADDYVTKPYTPEELLLRIKAVLRRTYHLTENTVVELGTVRVDLSSGIVKRPDGEVELTAKEFQLFSKLYDNQGKIVSLNALMDTLWPDGSYGLENSLIVHVRRLREKVEEDPSKPEYLQTVRGLGYRLNIRGRK
ncbi:DNA-binding response regulator [Butyrivibrio sp. X503]|uniref:response regulator transcription factor n=1 Tax=Butyrivibrio sp. X503 TaxID=2364878 RepID=UPI000EA93A90|nr:response regulator transcription factor [Butyrivibrio sp. X503]MBR4670360.1 response regulator transcription factor [Butyrivibrio sp.]RKM54655.1 DNA-binding response regulator [Butyrivibrio sp. X503]